MIAIVGTAGTTDLGAIDPLDALADRAHERGAWFHVDAAVGSGLDALRRATGPAARASSARTASPPTCTSCGGCRSAPARCSSRTSACLRAVHHASVYLNRPEDEAEGQLNLVGRSLDTSRRFDALKVLIALRATGRRRLGEMVDAVPRRSPSTRASAIDARPELELRRARRARSWSPSATAAATTSTSASTASCSRPAQAVIGRTRGRRRRRAQAHAAEPAHDARGRRRAARPRSSAREP